MNYESRPSLGQDRILNSWSIVPFHDEVKHRSAPRSGVLPDLSGIRFPPVDRPCITPARKFRILAHTNPTRSEGSEALPSLRVGFV